MALKTYRMLILSHFINIPIIFQRGSLLEIQNTPNKTWICCELNPESDKFVYNLSERRVILVLLTPQT